MRSCATSSRVRKRSSAIAAQRGDERRARSGDRGCRGGWPRPACRRTRASRTALSPRSATGGRYAGVRQVGDGKFYVADVVSISTEGVACGFLRGSEHLVTLDELRPCAFIPASGSSATGRGGGRGPARVLPMTPPGSASSSATARDHQDVPVAEYWVAAPRTAEQRSRIRVYTTLIAATLAGARSSGLSSRLC